MTTQGLQRAVAVAHALGHPARLRTVAMLRTGELCVCQIGEVLELAPSTVSAHLRELRQSGLTAERKNGRWVHISLSTDPLVQPWIGSALAMVGGDEQTRSDDRKVSVLRELPVEDLCRLGFEAATAKRGGSSRPRRTPTPGAKSTRGTGKRR